MENKSLKELKGNAKNPRTINKEDYKNLVQSIKRFGDLSGIVFNIETQQLAGGHQRQKAFAEIGADDIVITQRLPEKNSVGTTAVGYVVFNGERYAYREVSWSPDFEKAANVAANRIQGEFDLDLLAEITYEISQAENASDLLNLTGQTEDEINRLLDMSGASGESDPAEDEAPEVDEVNPPISKLGEIYQLGRHRLMCGDSTDFGAVSDLMDGIQADLVHTYPPYGVDYDNTDRPNPGSTNFGVIENDQLVGKEFENLLAGAFSNIEAFTKPDSAIYIWHASSTSVAFYTKLEEAGIKVSQQIIWKKPMLLGRGKYQWAHEPCIFAVKGSPFHTDDRTKTTVWDFGGYDKSSNDHPTQKPLFIPKEAIINSSQRGATILDLFGGSGSTLIACEEMDRNCYMMELDPKYCDVIRKRYHKHTTGQEDGWQEATKAINEVSDETTATAIPAES